MQNSPVTAIHIRENLPGPLTGFFKLSFGQKSEIKWGMAREGSKVSILGGRWWARNGRPRRTGGADRPQNIPKP